MDKVVVAEIMSKATGLNIQWDDIEYENGSYLIDDMPFEQWYQAQMMD